MRLFSPCLTDADDGPRYNGNGQLGIGSTDDLTTPKQVHGIPEEAQIDTLVAGDNHALALTSNNIRSKNA